MTITPAVCSTESLCVTQFYQLFLKGLKNVIKGCLKILRSTVVHAGTEMRRLIFLKSSLISLLYYKNFEGLFFSFNISFLFINFYLSRCQFSDIIANVCTNGYFCGNNQMWMKWENAKRILQTLVNWCSLNQQVDIKWNVLDIDT